MFCIQISSCSLAFKNCFWDLLCIIKQPLYFNLLDFSGGWSNVICKCLICHFSTHLPRIFKVPLPLHTNRLNFRQKWTKSQNNWWGEQEIQIITHAYVMLCITVWTKTHIFFHPHINTRRAHSDIADPTVIQLALDWVGISQRVFSLMLDNAVSILFSNCLQVDNFLFLVWRTGIVNKLSLLVNNVTNFKLWPGISQATAGRSVLGYN